MSPSTQNEFDRNAAAAEAEKTLRVIANLPAPAGIEDRVKAGLHAAPSRASVIEWPSSLDGRGWMHGSGMRTVAAAAIVLIVAGGGWGVYSHIQVAPAPTAAAAPLHPTGTGGFSAAGAKRTPQTLDGPVVAAPTTLTQGSDAGKTGSTPHHGKRRTSTTAKTAPVPAVR